jgi:ABC-2 type transport system permease protein
MRAVWAVFVRECKTSMLSMSGIVALTLWTCVTSLFFWLQLVAFEDVSQRALSAGTSDALAAVDVNDTLLAGLFSNVPLLFVLLLPVLSMRLWAAERSQATAVLLLAPGRLQNFFLGKLLFAHMLLGLLCAFLLLFPLLVAGLGTAVDGKSRAFVDFGQVFSSLFGLFWFGSVTMGFIAIASACTDHSITAVFGGIFISLLLWFAPSALAMAPSSTLSVVIGFVLPQSHLESFLRGVVDATDLAALMAAAVLAWSLVWIGVRRSQA